MNKVTEPKTIVYDYLFNYFGGDTFKDSVIMGASVAIAIRAYKEGKEVKFTKEPECYGKYFCDIYSVSFDREKMFVVEKDLKVDNLFRLVYGFDKIEAEVVEYSLDCLSSLTDDIRNIIPEELRNLPCSEPMVVSKDEFMMFLKEHVDDFDISDNVNAQVPSVIFI